MMVFDIQRFGGKGETSVTNTSSYEPTEYEIQLQKSQADYADAVSPNALYLNDVARQLLQDSIGTVQVDYNTLNDNAQRQIANAMGNLSGLTASNTGAADAANDTLANISNQYGQAANNNFGRLEGLVNQYYGASDDTNDALSQYMRQNNSALGTANNTLSGLQNGYLPSQYQQNMEDSIRSALNKTIGQNVNSLGQRGVINSSVTNTALNDIEKNAADAMAQQYLNNINTVGNLAQQQYSNSMNTSGTNASLAQQQLNNTNNALGNVGNIYNTQYDQLTGALGNQADLAQQQYGNTMGANSANAGIYESLINNATAPISTAAAAQEAAQAPATNLWNASLGLNSANTGALAAAAGKGTTTQTQTTSGGGSFLGGLLGAGIQALACFPAGTMVYMADDTKKDIKKIEVGDLVLSKDKKPQSVIKLMKPHMNTVFEVFTESGASTRTTLTQPFLMEDGAWKKVIDIGRGDAIKGFGPVTNIKHVGTFRVYDFETAGDNSYIVDGGFIAQGGGDDVWEED